MEFVVNSFVSIIEIICRGFMTQFTGSIWEFFAIPAPVTSSGGDVTFGATTFSNGSPLKMGWFDAILPGAKHFKDFFCAMAVFFATLLFLLNMIRTLIPDTPASKAAHPGYVIGRYIASIILVNIAYNIMVLIQKPISAVCAAVVSMKEGHKGLQNNITILSSTTMNITEEDITKGNQTGKGIAIEGTEMTLVQGVLTAFLLVTMTILLLKLVLEMVERFIITGFLFYAAPLAFSTVGSEGTSGIAKSYFQMIFSQYLLLMMNFMFLYVFMGSLALNENLKNGQYVFFYFCTLIAWLRLGTKVDELMKSLGLSAVQTGQGLMGEVMAGAGTTMLLGRSAMKGIKGAKNTATKAGAAGIGALASAIESKIADGISNNTKNHEGRPLSDNAKEHTNPQGIHANATMKGEAANKAGQELTGMNLKDVEFKGGVMKGKTQSGTELTAVQADSQKGRDLKQSGQDYHQVGSMLIPATPEINRDNSVLQASGLDVAQNQVYEAAQRSGLDSISRSVYGNDGRIIPGAVSGYDQDTGKNVVLMPSSFQKQAGHFDNLGYKEVKSSPVRTGENSSVESRRLVRDFSFLRAGSLGCFSIRDESAFRRIEDMSNVKNKAIKYRVYPNSKERTFFAKSFGCTRKVWNLMLSDKVESYEKDKTFVNVTPAMYKEEHPYLREVDSLALANVQLDLEKAVRDVKNGFGFPRFKSKRRSKRSYTTNKVGNNIEVGKDYIKLPKVGKVKAKVHRNAPAHWRLKSATVSQNASGKYFVSVLYEYEDEIKPVDIVSERVFGLDYKSNGLYVDNEGHSPGSPRYTHKYAKKLAKAQRRLSKKKGYRKGEQVSRNFIKQQLKVNKIHEKIANSRLDYLHKESLSIAKKADAVIVEDINMTDIAHAHGFRNYRKATYDNGFGIFRTLLEYKLSDRGKTFIKISKDFPSTKMCSSCGQVVSELPDSVRKWTCPHCGKHHDRDINAAINIRNEGLRLLDMKV